MHRFPTKSIILIFSLLLCGGMLFAQNHRGPTQPTGQVRVKHTRRPVPVKTFNAFPFAPLRAVDLGPYAPAVAQQPFKDCYAYASAYTGRTLLYNASYQITGAPDSTVFSPGFLQKMIYPKRLACRRNGYDTYVACQLLHDKGCVFRSDFPEDCTKDEITSALWTKALNYRVSVEEIYKPANDDATKEAAIKSALMAHHPVVIGWYSVDSFNGGGYGVECWQPDEADYNITAARDSSNHAVCIIGYDDDRFGGAFQIQNSWGTAWGKGGRMWIRYKDMGHFSAFGVGLSEINHVKP